MNKEEEILKAISELRDSNKRIERCLIGDDKFKAPGIIQTIKEHGELLFTHSEKHEKIDNLKRRAFWFFSGMVFALSFIIYGLKELWSYLNS